MAHRQSMQLEMAARSVTQAIYLAEVAGVVDDVLEPLYRAHQTLNQKRMDAEEAEAEQEQKPAA